MYPVKNITIQFAVHVQAEQYLYPSILYLDNLDSPTIHLSHCLAHCSGLGTITYPPLFTLVHLAPSFVVTMKCQCYLLSTTTFLASLGVSLYHTTTTTTMMGGQESCLVLSLITTVVHRALISKQCRHFPPGGRDRVVVETLFSSIL